MVVGIENHLTNMTATWDPQEKAGILSPESGWNYDDTVITYDDDEDPESSDPLNYDGAGENTIWTNENES